MEKIIDLLLFRFIDDKVFKSSMTFLLCLLFMYNVSLHVNHDKTLNALTGKVLQVCSQSLQCNSAVALQQFDVLLDAFDTWRKTTQDYRRSIASSSLLSDYEKQILQMQADKIDDIWLQYMHELQLQRSQTIERYEHINVQLNSILLQTLNAE